MRGCYTTEFGRGAGRGGVGAGKGGVVLHLDGLDTDRVAFMVYFWFGWNNSMGISGGGGGVDAVLGREQDRSGTGTGSWDSEYREKLVGVQGKSPLHNSSLFFFSSFPLDNLEVSSFPPSSPAIGPQLNSVTRLPRPRSLNGFPRAESSTRRNRDQHQPRSGGKWHDVNISSRFSTWGFAEGALGSGPRAVQGEGEV